MAWILNLEGLAKTLRLLVEDGVAGVNTGEGEGHSLSHAAAKNDLARDTGLLEHGAGMHADNGDGKDMLELLEWSGLVGAIKRHVS